MRLSIHRPQAALSLVAGAALFLAACTGAGSGSPPASSGGALNVTVSHTAAGDALAGANGMTLYILTNDHGSSTCTSGSCASTWPALKGEGSSVTAGSGVSGTWGTTTWDDGTKQVTHNGQPVYYYSGDTAAGDSNGQGTNNVWFIAPVDGSQGGPPSGQASTAPTPKASKAGYGY